MSGAKSAWEADFLPDVTRPENRKVPQMSLEGRLAISRRYTSGAKSAWEADFLPDVTRPENRKVPQMSLEGRLAISRRYTSGAKSAWEADFLPDVTRRENRKLRNGEGKDKTGKGSGETRSGRAHRPP